MYLYVDLYESWAVGFTLQGLPSLLYSCGLHNNYHFYCAFATNIGFHLIRYLYQGLVCRCCEWVHGMYKEAVSNHSVQHSNEPSAKTYWTNLIQISFTVSLWILAGVLLRLATFPMLQAKHWVKYTKTSLCIKNDIHHILLVADVFHYLCPH